MLNGDLNMGNSFNHPFVPQDLWQMPMTLEWDWAGMTDYGGMVDQHGVPGGLESSGVISNLPSSTSGFYQQNQSGTNGAPSK